MHPTGVHDVTTLPSLPPPAAAPVPSLTRMQKAAVIYRMLGSLGMSLPEGALTETERAELQGAVTGLEGLDPATLAGVIDEFLAALSPPAQGAPPPLPAPSALPELPMAPLPDLPALDPPAETPAQQPLHDPWARLAAQEDDALLALIGREAPEVGAVLISKLKVSRAAELLSRLPGPLARRITYSVSLIGDIAPETVSLIGTALASAFEEEAPRVFSDGPVERVGAILNFSRAATRNDMLEGLDETDPGFAEAVRKSIFTFANIPARIGPRDIPKIIKEVEQKDLVTALAGAAGSDELRKSADFILANISQRMADALRGEVEELETVSEADAEAAMTAIVGAIRALEEAGDIYLVAEEE